MKTLHRALNLLRYRLPFVVLAILVSISSLHSHSSYAASAQGPFNTPLSGLDIDRRLDYRIGQAIHEKIWVPSPSSTTASDGLGPFYNARSCAQCHQGNGRAELPPRNADATLRNPPGLAIRLSPRSQSNEQIPRDDEARLLTATSFANDPNYGNQIQSFTSGQLPREANVMIHYSSQTVRFQDGYEVELLRPDTMLEDLAYGNLASTTATSARIGQALAGLGLIDAIPAEAITSLADPYDQNNDGISGRANKVPDISSGNTTLGRYGWKAGQPSLEQQSAAALHLDMGLSSRLFPETWGDCTATQEKCRAQPHGNSSHLDRLEVADKMLDSLVGFLRYTAPTKTQGSKSRQAQHDVDEGQRIFTGLGCAACHQPSFVTQSLDDPLLNNKRIHPYSDFLLHDMGEGLADHTREFDAYGSEWRTAPLWGLSHTKNSAGDMSLLHDGRARNYLEAILWHAGEAESARQATLKLNARQREQLIIFLESI